MDPEFAQNTCISKLDQKFTANQFGVAPVQIGAAKFYTSIEKKYIAANPDKGDPTSGMQQLYH